MSKSNYGTTREPMFELENLYFDITSRSWKFCRMWCLDYHGFEAVIRLSTGRKGTQTSNVAQVRAGCLLMNQDNLPSCSLKPLRSSTFFRYPPQVPRKRVWLEILPHMARNVPTYTRQHTSRTLLTCAMSPKRKMVSPIRSAAILRLSTFRCRNSAERSVELISRGITCSCAACLDPQCRWIKCIRCKQVMTMPGLTPFDATCRFDHTSGRTSTTGRRQSMEAYLRIDLVEIIESASIPKTIHLGCTLTKWTRVNWMNFADNWTSCILWSNQTHIESIWSGLPTGEESEW